MTLRLSDFRDVVSDTAVTRLAGFDGNEESRLAPSEVKTPESHAEAPIVDNASTPLERTTWTEVQAVKAKSSARDGLHDLEEISRERRTFLNKYITSRPPPSSPPQYTAAGSYSTPTIPALHQNSVPTLIEHYRDQRDANPDAFDNLTRSIHQSLLDAKLARGGSPPLLQNEYSVELASRLDAETVSRWTERRQREEDEMSFFELEGDEDGNTNETVGQPTLPVSGSLHSPDHIDKSIISGSISHQTFETNKVTPNGSRVFTRRTVIEIYDTVEIPNKGTTDHTGTNDASLAREEEVIDRSVSIGPSQSDTNATHDPLKTMSQLSEEINKIK